MLAPSARERAEIALEMAEVYAALFRWVDDVDVIERALVDLGDEDEALAARLRASSSSRVCTTRAAQGV